MIEELYPIKGYEGLYSITKSGKVWSFISNKFLKLSSNGKYLTIGLHKDKKTKIFFIHRLVAKSFIKNPLNKKEINHIDGNRLNNSIENLEWVTPSENSKHSYLIGLSNPNKVRKLTMEQANEIRTKYKPKVYTIPKLSNEYGLSHSNIENIIYNKSYV